MRAFWGKTCNTYDHHAHAKPATALLVHGLSRPHLRIPQVVGTMDGLGELSENLKELDHHYASNRLWLETSQAIWLRIWTWLAFHPLLNLECLQ